jgi:hypothetical protein
MYQINGLTVTVPITHYLMIFSNDQDNFCSKDHIPDHKQNHHVQKKYLYPAKD